MCAHGRGLGCTQMTRPSAESTMPMHNPAPQSSAVHAPLSRRNAHICTSPPAFPSSAGAREHEHDRQPSGGCHARCSPVTDGPGGWESGEGVACCEPTMGPIRPIRPIRIRFASCSALSRDRDGPKLTPGHDDAPSSTSSQRASITSIGDDRHPAPFPPRSRYASALSLCRPSSA